MADREELDRIAATAAMAALQQFMIDLAGDLGYNWSDWDHREKLKKEFRFLLKLAEDEDLVEDLRLVRELRKDAEFKDAIKFAKTLKTTSSKIWTRIFMTVLTVLATSGALALIAAVVQYIRNALR